MCFNDGGCDFEGCFWVGMLLYDGIVEVVVLYWFDVDGVVYEVLSGVMNFNGIVWLFDGV